MKKLYLTTFAILLASSCTEILHAGLTISNWTNIPISIHIQAKHKNKKKETRHNEETFILKPIKTPFKAGDKKVMLADGGKGIHVFQYEGGIQFMEVYDATNPDKLKHLQTYFNGKSIPDFYRNPYEPKNAYENFFGVRLTNQTGEVLRDYIDIVNPDGAALYHPRSIKLN